MKLGRNLARLLWCTVQAHPVAETQREETRVVGAAGGRGGRAAPARPRAQRSRAQDHGLCGRLAGLANPGFGDFDGPTHPHTACAVHTRGAQGVANGVFGSCNARASTLRPRLRPRHRSRRHVSGAAGDGRLAARMRAGGARARALIESNTPFVLACACSQLCLAMIGPAGSLPEEKQVYAGFSPAPARSSLPLSSAHTRARD